MSNANLCVWAEIPGRPGYYDCLHCRLPLGHPRGQRAPREYPANVRRQCTGPPAEPGAVVAELSRRPTSIVTRARKYLSARDKWVAAGKPLRTDAEKALLFACCQACPTGEYDPTPVGPLLKGGKCRVCQCGVAAERNTLNKTAWATERCPRGHWDALGVAFVDSPSPTMVVPALDAAPRVDRPGA